MALVTKLKEYRERDDLKQAELAELVGVRRETIVNLEKREVQPIPEAGDGHCKGLSHHGGRIVCVYRGLKRRSADYGRAVTGTASLLRK